jgi:hypothetical protein
MRTKKPRKYAVINGNLVEGPISESYRKYLEATLPHRQTHSKIKGKIKPKDET